MLFLLVQSLRDWLEAHGLGFLRVFTFVTFQSVVAVLLSFLICIAARPARDRVAAAAEDRRPRQLRPGGDRQADGGQEGHADDGRRPDHRRRSRSPTLLLADLSNFYVRMALLCLVWLGAVGAVDDWLKLTAGRRAGSRQGLTSLEKLLVPDRPGRAALVLHVPLRRATSTPARTLYVPFFKDVQPCR